MARTQVFTGVKPSGWRDMNSLFPTDRDLERLLAFIESWHLLTPTQRRDNFQILAMQYATLELTWGDMEQLAEEFTRHHIANNPTLEKPGREDITASARVHTYFKSIQWNVSHPLKLLQRQFHRSVNQMESLDKKNIVT